MIEFEIDLYLGKQVRPISAFLISHPFVVPCCFSVALSYSLPPSLFDYNHPFYIIHSIPVLLFLSLLFLLTAIHAVH